MRVLCALLTGVVLPLLSQSIMFWQILLNKVVRNQVMKRVEVRLPVSLHSRYTYDGISV